MHKLRTAVALSLGLAVLAGLPAMADAEHRIDSLFQDEGKHPDVLQHVFVMPADSEGDVWFCGAYGNDFNKKNQGAVNFKATITRTQFGEEDVEIVRLKGKVKNNHTVKCRKTDELRKDDIVVTDITFDGFSRPKGSNAMNVITSIATARLTPAEVFKPAPPAPPAPPPGGGGGGGGDDPPPPPGGGGGGGNATNNATAAQVLRGCAGSSIGVQFRWQGGRKYADRRAGGSVTSVGPFSTFIEVANAAKSRWSCGSGISVSSSDAAQMPRLDTWGRGGGGRLLALRFEKSGGSQVYVDAFSQGTGAIHGSAFGSVGAAIRAFCGRSNISC